MRIRRHHRGKVLAAILFSVGIYIIVALATFDPCISYLHTVEASWSVAVNVFKADIVSPSEVTLVTTMMPEHLRLLERVGDIWKGTNSPGFHFLTRYYALVLWHVGGSALIYDITYESTCFLPPR